MKNGIVAVAWVFVMCGWAAAEEAATVELWGGGTMPRTADLAAVAGVQVFDIKPAQPGMEMPKGWIKGVHLAWHKDVLYASFGYNKLAHVQGENTKGEEALYLTSADGGKTWSKVMTIASGQGEVGISHGVMLSHAGMLWSFNGAFIGAASKGTVHTRAFTLDETTGQWTARGVAVEKGFWPLQEPIKMGDGNWIMSGARLGDGNPAAVAISHGDDLMKWDLVVIPKATGSMWGESAVLLDGKRIINIARYGKQRPVALVATSDDYGRTWTESRQSNLPMSPARPYANVLSTGQRYLVATTTADAGTRRDPLTICVSRPGETVFRRVMKVYAGVGVYPAAVEHDGVLYVGWTNKGGVQMARTPVGALKVE